MDRDTGDDSTSTLPPSFFRDLVESSDDLIWQCDNDGRFIYLNKAWETTLGYPVPEMLGRSFTDFMEADAADRDLRTLGEVLSTGLVKDYETVYLRKGGGKIELSFNARLVSDAEGKPLGARGVARDVSARKAMERAIAESEERYRQMTECSPLGMHFYELTGNDLVFTGFNPSANELLGVDNAQFIGKRLEDAFPALALTEIPERYRVVARNGVTWSTEQVIYKDDRIDGAFEVRAFKTGPGRMVAVFLDITARKRAEEELKREKERIAVTLASIGDGVMAADTKGTVTIMNAVAEKLTGWSAAEAAGRPLEEVFSISDEATGERSENPVQRVLRTSSVVELGGGTILASRDGRKIRIADSGAPILDSSGNTVGVVLVFRDVTEKWRMQEAIQRSQRLESLGILAGGIAHDFNNMLAGIFGYIDLANELSSEARVKDLLQKAFLGMDRAKGLTRQFLTFAKGGEPVLAAVDARALIEDAARFSLSGADVGTSFSFQEGLWTCEVDPDQFGQVIDNIIINARQAMPSGGTIRIEARNEEVAEGAVHGLKPGRYVVVSIADEGEGIPIENLPHVFDPFFTTKRAGNGLGLATCYSIMTRHGGAIEVESKPGEGSLFRLYVHASAAPATPRPTRHEPDGKMRGRVIVLDDEEAIRDILEAMLKDLGFTPVCVATAEAAEAAVTSAQGGEPVVAAILDLTIPGGRGGKEAAAMLKKAMPALPIFVASGYSEDPVMSDPASHGFSGSIAKPFRKAEVGRIISAGLARPR